MGRSGQGDRGDEARQEGDAVGYHQLHPPTHRRLQDAEVGRLHRSAAAQCLRKNPAPPPARSLLGGQGQAGELTYQRRPRARGDPYAVPLVIRQSVSYLHVASMKAGGYGSPLSRGRHMGCPTPSMLSRPHIAEQESRDLALLDFLAAFGDAVAAVMAVDVFERLVTRVTHAAMHLHGAIG